jgi:hypothetical protein
MINYSQYKRTVVDTGVFSTVSGAYTGAVEVLSGTPYISNTNNILIPTDTFESDILLSPFLKNRSITDTTSLPYKEKDILLQPNDILNGKVLNDRLVKLKTNNTYVYSQLFMANNNLPVSPNVRYAGVLSGTDTQLTFFNTIAATSPLTLSNYFSSLGDLQGFVYSENSKGVPGDFTIFAINNTEFIALTGNNSTIDLIELSNKIETQENSITYNDLKGICIADDFIFITDAGSGTIYKYDISGYINEDRILTNTRNLVEVLGNNTNNTSKPQQIVSNGKDIAFFDKDSSRVLIYDVNFNFIKRLTGLNTRRGVVKALQYNLLYNLLYILVAEAGIIKLYVYETENYTVTETHDIVISLSPDEDVKGLEFSKVDSDYYYIFTNQEIYKLFVSRPNVIIGRYVENRVFNTQFSTGVAGVDTPSNFWNSVRTVFKVANWTWNTIPSFTAGVETTTSTIFFDAIKDFKITLTLDEKDRVVYFSEGRIYVFDEINNFKRALKQSNLPNYNVRDVSVQNDEYIQPLSINKELYKIVQDVLTLKNNITGRFRGEYDSKGNVILKDYSYNLNMNDFTIQEIENYFLHNNEKVSLTVFNRVLSNILFLQNQLVEKTQIDFDRTLTPVPGIPGTGIDNILIID